jgi:formylglycine-generating enzyme required for sulfatase activity
MGFVYLAYDTLLARHVAVKFVASLEPDAAGRQRFLTEARAAARIQHPNVVGVYRVGELEEHPYLISEFVRGQTLDRIPKPMPWRDALQIGVELARGLGAAHRKGVLHRDIKPSNAILAEDGTAKLFDFGLAKLLEGPREERPDGPEEPATPKEVPAAPATAAVTAMFLPEGGASEGASRESGQLTRVGAVMGTPDYMAPEVWRGEPATRRSDVYSLGGLLYELCAGHPPHADVPLQKLGRTVQERDVPPLLQRNRAVDPRLAGIVDRCLRRDPTERFASGDELREALEQLVRSTSGVAVPVGNPYRGLRAFESEHRALFFGRSAEIGVLLDRLRAEPFVVVTGDSGVGKSSLCRAGVLPLVTDGALEDGRPWSVLTVVPGRHPLAAVAGVLGRHLGIAEADLARKIGEDAGGAAHEIRTRLGEGKGLVLFVDQLEELCTLATPLEAECVDDLLATLAAGVPGVRLVATVRTDFLTRAAALPRLGAAISGAIYVLRPLPPERIREVIIGPAEITGTVFESETLAETLCAATTGAAGALPLLEFALAELWEARDTERGMITEGALASLGGVGGALAKHADAVLAAMLPAERAAARAVLLRLVSADGTRVRRTLPEVTGGVPAAAAALDALVRGRLAVAYETEEGTACELAHEVLTQGWGTMRRWLHEDADKQLVRERLSQGAAEWKRLGRSPGALWSAVQIAEAAALDAPDLHADESQFLLASGRAVRRARWLRRGAVIGAPLLVAILYFAMELKARHEVARRVDAHLGAARGAVREAETRSKEASALRDEALKYFETGRPEPGEVSWARALSLGAEAERAYQRAAQALEAALGQDPAREDVRSLFSRVLFERARNAEREGRASQRDELVERLALYDDSGELLRAWRAPATLAVETRPRGALVSAQRYAEDEARKLRLGRVVELGTAPLTGARLAPGSYLLTLRALGRAQVRYPLLLGRGEELGINVELPPEAAVPKGYAYIPRGRFLFGAGGDEDIRRKFLETVPLHTVATEAYLIGEREVSFAEWIEFLGALAPAERRRRTPDVPVRVAGTKDGVSLREVEPSTWEVTLTAAGHTYAARAGEVIRYPNRSRRAVQDWLKLPVTGVSAQDAQAYTDWLSRSGRLPGARLCTEYEWERAGRGADDREFPHGRRLDADDANFDETYGKRPGAMGLDEVGTHPASRSPFGLDDLTGNAWEWTISSLAAGQFVARGGSGLYDQKTSQLTNRQVSFPTLRDAQLGVRVCAPFRGEGR